MSTPRISLCIPNYNNAAYLRACIDSALTQTGPGVEVVVADDASTDASLAVLKSYGERIRLLTSDTNLGQPDNTTRCLEAARGDYAIILHSDDQLLPGAMDRLARMLDAHPEAVMAVGERMETDETGAPWRITPFYDRDCVIDGERQAKVFMFMSFLPCQVMFRRQRLLDAGGVDPRHVVNLDGLLWFRLSLHGDVAYTRTPVGIYRIHAGSTTAHYNRRFDHLLAYYATLSEMFRLGRGRPYLEAHVDAATKRVGQLSVRYCHDVLAAGDLALARRYLALATVFDPALEADREWRALDFCARSDPADALEHYRALLGGGKPARAISYAPPEGARPLAVTAHTEGEAHA